MRLYVHVPFCSSKCYYCSFYSMNRLALIPDYLKALRAEFALRAPRFFESIYIGGGTPSVLEPKELDELLGIFDGCCRGEYTVEMNPESVSDEKMEVLIRHGVNRVSLGVQSTVNTVLERMGRRHTLDTVNHALETIRRGGVDNISVDFITGFAGQTNADADAFVRLALRYAKHVSVYSLEYSGTRIPVLGEDEERALFYHLKKRLEEAGFARYEISNFARPGFESSHNSAYWTGEEYLGLGPGASSFDGETRTQCLPNLGAYIAHYSKSRSDCRENVSGETESFAAACREGVSGEVESVAAACNVEMMRSPHGEDFEKHFPLLRSVQLPKDLYAAERQGEEDRRLEGLILPLRTCKGVDVEAYRGRFGIDLTALRSVQILVREGLMTLCEDWNAGASPAPKSGDEDAAPRAFLRFTDRGFDLSNAAYVKILEEMEEDPHL